MGAPVLIETTAKNPLDIAKEEFEKGAIPITVRRRRDAFVWLQRHDLF